MTPTTPCAAPDCARVFVRDHPGQRYCSARCRAAVRVAYNARWRAERRAQKTGRRCSECARPLGLDQRHYCSNGCQRRGELNRAGRPGPRPSAEARAEAEALYAAVKLAALRAMRIDIAREQARTSPLSALTPRLPAGPFWGRSVPYRRDRPLALMRCVMTASDGSRRDGYG